MSTSKPGKPEPAPDAAAAHEFLTELRTRITTQPLPYQHGVESRALESLREVFGHAREAMKKHPGCGKFAQLVTDALNRDVRPLTAKWHRARDEGRLKSRDGADEFRGDLETAQRQLRALADELHLMAYGSARADRMTPPAILPEEVEEDMAPMAFGITPGVLLPAAVATAINESEAAEIKARRGNVGVSAPEGQNAVGLALSGGGIRSATFCLGAVQVLADRHLLRDVDFLSTVSGGGYTGSFLTRQLGEGDTQESVASPGGPDTASVRSLRLNAKFIAARNLKESWSMLTATLAGMLLNWTAPVVVIILAALAAERFPGKMPWRTLFIIAAAVTLIVIPYFGWRLKKNATSAKRSGMILGSCMAVVAMIGVCWLIETGYDTSQKFISSLREHHVRDGVLAALAGLVAVTGPVAVRFLPILKKPATRRMVLKILTVMAGLLLPLIALAAFYYFSWLAREGCGTRWILAGVAAAMAVVAFSVLNINLTGPHRLYRDGLSKTFVERSGDAETVFPLAGINPRQSAPYHLINTALNIPASESPAVRDRRCDFFLFSKHWTGSPATGYHETQKWRTNGRPVDLATAMATSGAAMSAWMGLGSMPALTALLTFLNVRLGFWIRKPGGGAWAQHPGFLCLMREMWGICMSEKQKWLNLSDGGHIENMGAYELLRRRCKFIIIVDGEADPLLRFQGLMTLTRHAQIDFGVRIDSKLDSLRPDPVSGLSQTHAHFCRIYYPAAGGQPAGTGLLLYLKLSLTGNESELIKRYRINNPGFPHQSTLDQFFDEEQFEAYRQLGVHVAEGLFSKALMAHPGEAESARGFAPENIPDWFRRLAGNLLESEKPLRETAGGSQTP